MKKIIVAMIAVFAMSSMSFANEAKTKAKVKHGKKTEMTEEVKKEEHKAEGAEHKAE